MIPFHDRKNDDSDPSEIIPVSFNAYNILEEIENDVCRNEGKFFIQMCSQAKTSGTKLLGSTQSKEGAKSKLEGRKQHAMSKKGMTERLHIGQGRAGLRRKQEPDCINQPSEVTRRILEIQNSNMKNK